MRRISLQKEPYKGKAPVLYVAQASADKATLANPIKNPGGIDLNTSNGMQWHILKDGRGVEMNMDPAMMARIRQEGIDSLSPVIFRMTPVKDMASLLQESVVQ